jgi:chromate transporter
VARDKLTYNLVRPSLASRSQILQIAGLFLRLGITAFGGPAAHISIFHDEVVERRKWLTDQEFLDLLGATNLIPGPNSTEMAIHIGFVRAGWIGLVLAGTCFILPAMLIVIGLSWLYVQYGNLPQARWIMYGIQPVVIAIIIQALFGLGRKAIKGILLALIGSLSLILYFLNINPILILLIGGVLALLAKQAVHIRHHIRSIFPYFLSLNLIPLLSSQPYSSWILFFTFLKIGAVLYGSGYVLFAFLYAEFVEKLGWLTQQQLIDAIAIGQVTPGPVFTSATFIGYILGGLSGAVIATVGIFLPSFIFVAMSNPLIPKIRNSLWAGSFLDGVNVASLGLMAGVTWLLGRGSFPDLITAAIGVISLVLLLKFKINSTWLILGGLLIGLAASSL